jgi:1-acyl-sn-glycerol-3-phosphate acyltransferase
VSLEHHQVCNPPRSRKNQKQPGDPRYARYPLRRGLIGNIAYLFGIVYTRFCIYLHAKGRHNIPEQTPYIIAANHETYVDGLWISAFLPRSHFRLFSCIAAKDLEDKHGLFGKIIVHVGRAISVDRFGNPVRGLIIACKKVREGNILLVHPEGTRTKDGRLGEFKEGAAYISLKTNVPLLPVFIDGGYEVFNRHMKTPQPFDTKTKRKREVIVVYGKPLNPADFKNAKEMTQALRGWMSEQYEAKRIPRILQ